MRTGDGEVLYKSPMGESVHPPPPRLQGVTAQRNIKFHISAHICPFNKRNFSGCVHGPQGSPLQSRYFYCAIYMHVSVMVLVTNPKLG